MDNNLNPYQEFISPEMPPQKNGPGKRTIIALTVLALLVLAAVGYQLLHKVESNPIRGISQGTGSQSTNNQSTGTLQFSYGKLATSDVTVTVNGKKLTGSDIFKTSLQPGNYSVTVSKPGYKNYVAQAVIIAGHTTNISPVLSSSGAQTTTPKPITSWSQITIPASQYPDSGDNAGPTAQFTDATATINDTVYFDSSAWAVVYSDMSGDETTAVVHYSASSKNWICVAGPVSGPFARSLLTGIPSDIMTYLQDNNLVYN